MSGNVSDIKYSKMEIHYEFFSSQLNKLCSFNFEYVSREIPQ